MTTTSALCRSVFTALPSNFRRVDRSFQTAARAKPVRPERTSQATSHAWRGTSSKRSTSTRLICDLQARNYREREEGHRLEGRGELTPELAGGLDAVITGLDHLFQTRIRQQAGDRQLSWRGRSRRRPPPLLLVGQPADGSQHVVVLDPDDDEVVRVVGHRRGDRAAAQPKPRTRPSPTRPVPRWRSTTAILRRSRSVSASTFPPSTFGVSTSNSVTIWSGTSPITRASPSPCHGIANSLVDMAPIRTVFSPSPAPRASRSRLLRVPPSARAPARSSPRSGRTRTSAW